MSDKDVKFYLGCREFSYVHGENEWRTPDNQYVMKRFYGHDNMTVIDSEGGIVARDLPSDFENISSVYIEDTPQRTVHLFDKGGKNAAGKTLVDYKKDLNCPDMSWIPDIVAGGLPPPITAADFISEETPAEFAERILNAGTLPQEASGDFEEPQLNFESFSAKLDEVQVVLNGLLLEVVNRKTVDEGLFSKINATRAEVDSLSKAVIAGVDEGSIKSLRERYSSLREQLRLVESTAWFKNEKRALGATIALDYMGIFNNADHIRFGVAADLQLAKRFMLSPKLQGLLTPSKPFKHGGEDVQGSGFSVGSDLSAVITKDYNAVFLARAGGTIGWYGAGGKGHNLFGTVEGGFEYKVYGINTPGLSLFLGGGAFCGLPDGRTCEGMIIGSIGATLTPLPF